MSRAAIIMPTWDNSACTLQCLESLAKHTEDYTLIWIDNGSEPGEKSRVEQSIERLGIPYKPFFNPKNLGFPKAVNQGIKIALAGDYNPIVLLNNDVVLTRHWLLKLEAILNSNPIFGLIGSIHDKGTQGYYHFSKTVKFIGGDPEKFFNDLPPLISETSACVPFSCVAVRREVIEKVGLLDEAFSPCLGEDNDYCDRVRLAGWKTGFCLNCFTWHQHRSTVHKIRNIQFIKRRNERLLAQKRIIRARGRR